jgi:hypothetical protein
MPFVPLLIERKMHIWKRLKLLSCLEDLLTLYQFDKYVRNAQESREKIKNGEGDSDDGIVDAFLHDILNVEIIEWVRIASFMFAIVAEFVIMKNEQEFN